MGRRTFDMPTATAGLFPAGTLIALGVPHRTSGGDAVEGACRRSRLDQERWWLLIDGLC
jgi:hypothetical protein